MSQKILVVEDDPFGIDVISRALQTENYTLFTANNGEEAYMQALEIIPDIILMDVKMPGLNGYETCKIFKLDKKLMDIPVIFVTATTLNIEEAFVVGGADYVNKPINQVELKSRVGFHLERQRFIEEIQSLNVRSQKKIEQQAADLAYTNRKLFAALDELKELKSIHCQ